jgi:hypothetical protein
MEVQLQRRCSQRTAERHLNERGWQYARLLAEHPTAYLNDCNRLSEFDRGRYVGILESQVSDMKAQRGLK